MTLTVQQLAERKLGIGGSDAPAALGLSQWRTPRELYEEKISEEPQAEVTEGPLLWGGLLEPLIRQRYADRTGRVVRVPDTLWSDQYPWMLAHLDGVTDCGRGFEAKTARFADEWGEPGTDQIPQPYLIQVQHCMIVTGLTVFDVCVLIGGSEERQYEVPADPELQSLIVEQEAVFWSHVEKRVAPPIDFNAPGALSLVRKLYPGTDGSEIVASASAEAWRVVMQEANDTASTYASIASGAKAHLLAVMESAAKLKFSDGYTLTRKAVVRKAYAVPESTYIDARITKGKEKQT